MPREIQLTEAQKQVMVRAHELLSEHFVGHVMTVMIREHADGVEQEQSFVSFQGGRHQAIGLCMEAHRRISNMVTHYGPNCGDQVGEQEP